MLVRIQDDPEMVETNYMLIAKLFWKTFCPVNLLLFQIIMDPPNAPFEGI
jgi:hypothetical protein